MNTTAHIKSRLPALALSLLCFSLHVLLIFYHVYVDVSNRGLYTFPKAPIIDSPTRWHMWLDLSRWDSGRYEKIVLNGYRDKHNPDKPTSAIQCYPGYPLLAKSLCAITGAMPTQGPPRRRPIRK